MQTIELQVSEEKVWIGVGEIADDDVVLCDVCVSQGKKENLTLSTEKEDTFISTSFSNWKRASKKFRKYQQSSCHRVSVSMPSIRETWL